MSAEHKGKEFIATHSLMYNGNLVGYKGYIMLDGKRSDTCDITLDYMSNITKNYNFELNTQGVAGRIEMTREGNLLYSDKGCPILQPFNIYRMLGFKDYKRNNNELQELSRELSDTYFNGNYKNIIVVKDASLTEHVSYEILNKNAIEITINSRTTQELENGYLLHILIAIDTYFTSQGAITNYTESIKKFNDEHKIEVPLSRKFTINRVNTTYECRKCKKVHTMGRKVTSLKNFRCRCGGTIKLKEE